MKKRAGEPGHDSRPRLRPRTDARVGDRGVFDRSASERGRRGAASGVRPRGPRPGAFRYRVDLEYVGTRYSGWQFQTNARTVAGELMEAAHRATGHRILELYGSGRTDAGVHAIHQVAHVDFPAELPPVELMARMNDELPPDINILKVERAPEGFHARFSADYRTYLYRISRRRTAFEKSVVWWVRDPLDVKAMTAAARGLQGFHDFAAFAQIDEDRKDQSTTVKVENVDVFERGDSIFIRMTGSHFLWKMVRRIVGMLVEVGRGNLRPEELLKLLKSAPREGDGEVAAHTAPPSGLSLETVTYPQDADRRPPETGTRGDAGRSDRRDIPPQRRPEAFREPVPRFERKDQPEREVDTRASERRPLPRWPRQSTSRESLPERGKPTFRRRG